jgi:hypothetical protein
LVSRDSNGWGDVRACVKAHRLGIAATFVLIAAFLLALAVSALLPGASLSHPPLAHAALAVEQLTIERQTARSDIIVVGNVVRVDKARWNGSGGKKPGQLSCLPDVMPIVYSTFYVEPSQVLKGVQRWGAPIAFRTTAVLTGSNTPAGFVATLPSIEDTPSGMEVAVGDRVVAFGEADATRYGAGCTNRPAPTG